MNFRFAMILICAALVVSSAGANDKPENVERESKMLQQYLIEGVYYLINEGDRDMALEQFRKAIFFSPFNSLSKANVTAEDRDNRWVAAEAFYFLGRIYYEKAILDIQNIAWAKKYLKKAEEYGIVYDRLHPPLMDEINRKYPEIEVPIAEASFSTPKANILVEIGDSSHGSYQINTVKIDQHADVTEGKFRSDQIKSLECGARYKMKPDIEGAYKSMYRALTILGIGIVIWLSRG